MSSPRETYLHGHHRSVLSAHSARTAEDAAAFLLPYIEPGMRLLDFGCGPGTITVGLADAVGNRGSVLGIDISEGLQDRMGSAIERDRLLRIWSFASTTYTKPNLSGISSMWSTRIRYCSISRIRSGR